MLTVQFRLFTKPYLWALFLGCDFVLFHGLCILDLASQCNPCLVLTLILPNKLDLFVYLFIKHCLSVFRLWPNELMNNPRISEKCLLPQILCYGFVMLLIWYMNYNSIRFITIFHWFVWFFLRGRWIISLLLGGATLGTCETPYINPMQELYRNIGILNEYWHLGLMLGNS